MKLSIVCIGNTVPFPTNKKCVKRQKIDINSEIFLILFAVSLINQVQNMASIHDMPEEIMLKMVNFLELKDIAKFGEVSKRMRAISRVQSLWQKINLLKYRPGRWSYEIDVPTGFLKMAIENGCQYLSLLYMKLGTPGDPITMKSDRDLCLHRASCLKYLDLSFCEAHSSIFEEILASCHSLQKLSMASTLDIHSITSKMINSICYQNGRTLETLNLSACRPRIDSENYQKLCWIEKR